MSLQAILYKRGQLQLLDQRRLPHEFTYLDVPDPKTAWHHIRDMVVRGAPAIGVTGVLAIAADLVTNKGAGSAFKDATDAVTYINTTLDYLVTSRPTAVNLADGADRLRVAAKHAAESAGATAQSVVEAVIKEAEEYFDADLKANKAMGAYGSAALLEAASKTSRWLSQGGKIRVLTHCNTGSLATAGYGTALGIIRSLHEQGKLEHVYCTETRPYNQGARLTAFELIHDGLPATLICDSAAAHLMGQGQVDAVVVGADRVVANGDTANKIGTYMLSLVSHHHGVPFFIAAPTTTLDATKPDGSHIEIEQRPPEELTHFRGQRVVTEKIEVWNPSFDVAPGKLITGIVTEVGCIPKEGPTFKVAEFLSSKGKLVANGVANGHTNGAPPSGSFYAFDQHSVIKYVQSKPELLAQLGPPGPDGYAVREVGDGNINFVWILEGPQGSLVLKQSLPYVRCVGESWPLTQERLRIESSALQEEAKWCPQHVPAVYLYDPGMAVVAMQYIKPPAIILRRGLIQGSTYPHLADHLSTFMAQTLFNSSYIALSSKDHKAAVARYLNPEMCELTEKVIFTEPYTVASNNRHNSPHLDADVAELQADVAAKVAISDLKHKFMTAAEALLHGDLHTGSVMVTQEETYVIDPEFAYYGPIAFDVAKILANLLLALFASYGQEAQSGESRDKQRAWLSQTTSSTWTGFSSKFLALWSEKGTKGEGYPEALLGPGKPAAEQSLQSCQAAFMRALWKDTVAFMGSFMIRRIVGIAHVADLDSISDAAVRAGCERRALRFGRSLLVTPGQYTDVAALVEAAEAAAAPA